MSSEGRYSEVTLRENLHPVHPTAFLAWGCWAGPGRISQNPGCVIDGDCSIQTPCATALSPDAQSRENIVQTPNKTLSQAQSPQLRPGWSPSCAGERFPCLASPESRAPAAILGQSCPCRPRSATRRWRRRRKPAEPRDHLRAGLGFTLRM